MLRLMRNYSPASMMLPVMTMTSVSSSADDLYLNLMGWQMLVHIAHAERVC